MLLWSVWEGLVWIILFILDDCSKGKWVKYSSNVYSKNQLNVFRGTNKPLCI